MKDLTTKDTKYSQSNLSALCVKLFQKKIQSIQNGKHNR